MISAGNFRRFGSAALCASLTTTTLLAATSATFADVKLTQTTTMKSTAPQMTGGKENGTVTTTAYYKGNKVRQETPDQIILLDGDANKTYVINKAQKSYTILPSVGALRKTPGMDGMRFDTKATVTPTGQTKTIAGKVAKGYKYTATITISMKANPQMPNAPKGTTSMFPTIRISGETWTTDALQVPIIAAQSMFRAMSAAPGMDDFAKKMSSVKGLPLESTMTTNVKGGMMTAAGGSAQGIFITNKTVTTGISEGTLPASLFTIPAGYQKTEMTRRSPQPVRRAAP